MKNLSLYCNCYNYHENLSTQFNQKNLMCGAYSFSQEYRKELTDKGFLFDDVGDNISDKNLWLGDLTGLYWVWKNTNDEFVGTNHYRRFWREEDINNLELNENTIYVTTHELIHPKTVEQQFIHHHGRIGMDILKYVSKTNKINMPIEMIEGVFSEHSLSTCNMFFCDRVLFNKLCGVLFEIIFELYEGTKHCLPFIQIKTPESERKRTQLLIQTRLIAFLSERILTVIYANTDYYFGKNINIQDVRFNFIRD